MTSLQVTDDMLWKDAPAGLKSFRQEEKREREKGKEKEKKKEKDNYNYAWWVDYQNWTERVMVISNCAIIYLTMLKQMPYGK